MALIVFIIMIWLIVLQVTVNRLQNQITQLKNFLPKNLNQANLEDQKEQLPTSNVLKQQEEQSPFEQPVQACTANEGNPPLLQQPKEEFTAPQPAPAKPPVEITAAKLFSWIGGFMLFLGVIFGIKYAVENNLLSPTLRVVLSILIGVVLATGGYLLKAPKYRVLAHTLLGSGLSIVYAAIFCAHAFYNFISLTPAFLLMAATSFAALGAALKKEAKYVGYLGAVIAFLTPILLNNGSGAWVAFFLYVFCINAAAVYAAVQKGWNGLLVCTLSFTWLSQAAWLFPFQSSKLLGVVIFFSLYALASAWLARRHKTSAIISYAIGGFLVMELALMLPIGIFLPTPPAENGFYILLNSLELLGYVLLVNGLILILAEKESLSCVFARIAKVVSFLILCTWLFHQASFLPAWLTLGACILFAALNGGVELAVFQNTRKPDSFSVFYPVATMGGLLVLSLVPSSAATLDFISVFCILGLLLVGTLVLAVLSGILWILFVAVGLLFLFLLVTLITGISFHASSFLVLLTGFIPLLLCTGSFFALRRLRQLTGISLQEKAIGAVTSLAPFVLILTLIAQGAHTLSLYWILAATWVVCALTVLLAWLYKNTFTLPAAALGAGCVQLAAWGRFVWGNSLAPIDTLAIWIVALLSLFVATPFLSKEHFWNKPGSWISCALSGLSSCLMGCLILAQYCRCNSVGIVPAVLLGIYGILLYKLWGKTPTPQAHPISIGFMSATVLLLLTIIFPLEIHNYWLWVAWAAEAVFLANLNRKIPYDGWKIVIIGLLCMVAARLLLGNDFSPFPNILIWNWYLWVYALSAFAFFVVARWWNQPAVWKKIFYSLGGCILFWLLNIQIAHWFSPQHALTFDFTGQLAQALTYTLAWGLFALGTIGLGLYLQKSPVSKAGIGVMMLALGKFFLSDIWQLEALYRILGLFGLAVLLIVASFWYQKKQKVR